MEGYDIIGDIHGHARALEELLRKLGYRHENGVYAHPTRSVLFLGDFIDRGPEQRRVLDIVRPMVDRGSALAVMGNHEFNAICFHIRDEANGQPLRPHSEKNLHQHDAFLREFPLGSPATGEMVDWFMTLPVFLELDGLRAVHACWSDDSIGALLPHLTADNQLTRPALAKAASRGSFEFQAIEILLKGPEMTLPGGYRFHDKDGIIRDSIRTKWWTSEPRNYRDLALVRPEALREIPPLSFEDDTPFTTYGADDKPVFFGHYWLSGEPELMSRNAVCLDYSVAAGGLLAAYRWSGERQLSAGNFVFVSCCPD